MRRRIPGVLALALLAAPAIADEPAPAPGATSWLGIEPSPPASPTPPRDEPRPAPADPVAPRPAPYDVVAFAPDGSWSAGLGEADREILLERFPLALDAWTLEGHQARVTALEFSHDGAWLVSGDAEGEVLLWDLGAWEPRRGGPGPALHTRAHVGTRGRVRDLEFSPRGDAVAVAAADRGLVTFLRVEGTEMGALLTRGPARALAFSEDGRHLAVGMERGVEVMVWPRRARGAGRNLLPAGYVLLRETFAEELGPVEAVRFLPDGRGLLVADADGLRLVNVEDGSARELPGRAQGPDTLAVSADGTRVAQPGSATGSLEILRLDTGRVERTFSVFAPRFGALHFLPDDASVACAGSVFRGVAGRWALLQGR